jgi:hypothetical protein
VNSEHPVSIRAVISVIRQANVLAMAFPMLRRALLVDLRTSPTVSAFVRLAPMARSPEERLKYFKRMRPALPELKEFSMVPWTRSVASLEPSGVFGALLEQIAATGDATAVSAARDALRQLMLLEQAEIVAAVRGENYRTLWASR